MKRFRELVYEFPLWAISRSVCVRVVAASWSVWKPRSVSALMAAVRSGWLFLPVAPALSAAVIRSIRRENVR